MRERQVPLRIGYLMTHHPRVATTFINGEIRGLEALGDEIVAVAMNPPAPEDLTTPWARDQAASTLYLKSAGSRRLLSAFTRFASRDPLGAIRLVAFAVGTARLDLGLVVRRLAHLLYASLVVEHLRDRGIRHVHAHFGQAPATIAWFATLIANREAAAAVDGDSGSRWTWSFTIHGFQDFVNEADARLDLKAGSAAFIACISDFTRSQLCRVTDPAHWDRFVVQRCGIDLDAFPLHEVRATAATPRLVTVARLSPEKGQVVLLDAVAALRERGVDTTLEVIGSGPYRPELEVAVARLGIADVVSFSGELLPDAVAARLRESDIFCLPSFSEGLPVSIMEAMAIGVPVVSTAISGIPELAVHDETALTVPPGNADALAAAIERLATEEGLAERLVAAARAAVAEHHDVRRTVPAMHELLAAAVGAGPPT